MRDRPDLPDDAVVAALAAGWGIEARSIEYAAVGAGSYHWQVLDARGQRWFVTVDDLSWSGVSGATTPEGIFEDLRAAYETALALQRSGLDFVLAPRPASDGAALRRIGERWSMALFPHSEGSSNAGGEWRDAAQRQAATRLVGKLHAAIPPATIQRWSPDFPNRPALELALDSVDVPWHGGPFSEEARALLAASRSGVRALLARYDGLCDSLAASDEDWVVTHGEPHCRNFIDTTEAGGGSLYLIDWDTVRLAPRERDLHVVVGDDLAALAAYRDEAGAAITPRPELMQLFGLRWQLTDIAVWSRLRGRHSGSADDAASLAYMKRFLPSGASSDE